MERRTLSLKKRPDPATRPKVDPKKAAIADQLGMRFVDRSGRYIAQKLVVTYEFVCDAQRELSRTWIDVPLVPETYHV